MLLLRAAALGALATALLGYGMVTVASVMAMRAGGTLEARLGPVLFAAVERTGDTSTTTYGAGLLLAAALGGGLNGAAAILLARRRAHRLARGG